jgi:hypothetical protein
MSRFARSGRQLTPRSRTGGLAESSRCSRTTSLRRSVAGSIPAGRKRQSHVDLEPRLRDTGSVPRVFVSYSHDSDEHKSNVLLLVQSLRALGIDARVDELVIHEVGELAGWMRREQQAADYVLVICSDGYLRKSAANADQDHGTGVGWTSPGLPDTSWLASEQ